MIQGKIWGTSEILFKNNNVEVHICNIKKGSYCSWHSHTNKVNMFYVLSGTLEVVIDKTHCYDKVLLSAGQSTAVDPRLVHQFRCYEEAIILEIYYTKDIDLHDIVRLTNGGLNTDMNGLPFTDFSKLDLELEKIKNGKKEG